MSVIRISIISIALANIAWLLYYIFLYEYYSVSVLLIDQKGFDVLVLVLYIVFVATFTKARFLESTTQKYLFYLFNGLIGISLLFYLVMHDKYFPFIYFAY